MKFFSRLSIKSKMTVIIMLTSCIALVAACLVLIGYELVSYRRIMIRQMSMLVEITGKNCSDFIITQEPKRAEEILANLASDNQIVSACIYGKDGGLWAAYSKGVLDPAFFEKPDPKGPNYRFDKSGLHVFGHIVDRDGETLGTLYLHSNLEELYARLYQHIGIVAAVLVLASLMALLISARLQRVISQPVLDLAKTARSVSEKKDYAVRAHKQGDDEVGTLIDSFNEMLAQIQKRDTELQEARVAAERANQAKSNFLSFMSHELRTPLTSIIGFSEMLISDLGSEQSGDRDGAPVVTVNLNSEISGEPLTPTLSPSTPSPSRKGEGETSAGFVANSGSMIQGAKGLRDGSERRVEIADDLRRIHDSGRYLLELINDILDISKIEAGKMDVHLETFDVGSLVRDLNALMRPQLEGRRNRLVIDCPPNIGSMQADRIKVRQCILNLLSNASKFTDQGVVTFSTVRVARNGSESLVFRISDTGIGMTQDQMSRLFRAFTQGDDSTSRRYGGTGLGLALTKKFCQMMGGDVTVASEPGKGSTFTIELPAIVSGSAGAGAAGIIPARVAAESRSAASDGCILVIDDDPSVHELLSAALKPEGYTLRFASNGAEGLRLAKELHPAVITLDVLMPEMDGWVVLSLLKADADLADIPVIMLTVRAEQDFGFAMGVADYLQKPIDRDRLLSVLRKYRGRHPGNQVLIVEDDTNMREMLSAMLSSKDWDVAQAANGLTALESITRSQPSLILLDLRMPVMDGFQMIAELHKHEDWRKIPVVVVSAKEITPEDRLRLQGHVQKILQKGDFGREELMREVQQTVKLFLAQDKELLTTDSHG